MENILEMFEGYRACLRSLDHFVESKVALSIYRDEGKFKQIVGSVSNLHTPKLFAEPGWKRKGDYYEMDMGGAWAVLITRVPAVGRYHLVEIHVPIVRSV